jgi:hypothetical protein
MNMTDLGRYETTQGPITDDDDCTLNTVSTQFGVSQRRQKAEEEQCLGTFTCSVKILKFEPCFDCSAF